MHHRPSSRPTLAAAMVLCLAAAVSGCAELSALSIAGPSTPAPAAANNTKTAESLRLARIMRDNGRLAAAVDIYGRIDEKGGLSPRELLEYASVAAQVLPPQESLPLFVRARQRLSMQGKMKADERLAVCLGIGRGRLALAQLDGAAESFRCALEEDGENVSALNGLGVVLAAQGQNDEAHRLLSRALDLDPANTAVRNNLALGQIGNGDTKAAIALLDTGGQPASPTLVLNLALAHLLEDDEAAAQRVLIENMPRIRWTVVMESLKQSAARIRAGQPPAREMLAASRRLLPLESIQ